MKFARQGVVFGGVIVLLGCLAPAAQVLAFGQQWRPAVAYAEAQPRHYQQVAKLPSFRPQIAARPNHFQPYQQPRQRPYPPQPQFASWQSPYGAVPQFTQGYPSRYTQSHQPRFAAAPMWARPFDQMAQVWQPPAPLFTRQFGWRPAAQPWVAANSSPQRAYPYQGQAQAAPRFSGYGYGQAMPEYAAPAYGNWRPAPQRMYEVRQQYYGYQPGYGAGQQRMIRPAQQGPAWPAAGQGIAAANPGHSNGYPPAYWRPGSAMPATPWPGASFRPVGYGRSVAAEDAVAARNEEPFGFAREHLPGWVTTYPQTDDVPGCTWCSGS